MYRFVRFKDILFRNLEILLFKSILSFELILNSWKDCLIRVCRRKVARS
jgi:hypothetical protein